MTFPTPFTVGWHSATRTESPLGEDVISYSPPLDQPGTPRDVIGWAPTQATEPEVGRVVGMLDLLVPDGFHAGPDDVVDLPDGRFEVVGHPMSYSTGPFGFTPGGVVQLRRVQR